MQMIDVKAAREYVETNYICDPLLRHMFQELLDQLPKVEVVRCKDCKHRRNHSCYREHDRVEKLMAEKGITFVHNAPTYPIASYDDFCSYGERRNDG